MKNGQIRSYFWSVFSCIRSQSKYRKIRTRNNSRNTAQEFSIENYSKEKRREKMFYFSLFELFSILFLFSQMLNTPIYASPALKSKFPDHSGFIKSTRHSLTLSRKLPYFPSFFEIEQGFVYRIPFIDCNFNLKISWGKMCRFCQYHEIVGNEAKRANRYFKKTKHCKFSEKRTFFTP